MARRPRVVIVGGRFGGLTAMHWIRRLLPRSRYDGVLVDSWPAMVYRPSLVYAFWRPPGFVRGLRLPLERVCRGAGFAFLEDRVVHIDADRQAVHLASHHPLHYDVLFLASGSDPGWTTISGLDTTRGGLCEDYLARQTAYDRQHWQRGTFVFAAAPLHARPDAPVRLSTADEFMLYESSLLWDSYCRRHGLRPETDIVFVTPAPVLGEALGPSGRTRLADIMDRRGVRVLTGARYLAVTDGGIRLHDRFLPADAMVWVPPYVGSGLARVSGLDDGYGWVPVDPHLRHPRWPNIYAVGDVTTHVPKLGHAAMVQARVAVHHWVAQADRKPTPPPYHPQVLALIDIGQGAGFFSLSTVLVGGNRDVTVAGPGVQWAKRLFNAAYLMGGGWLAVMP